MSIMIRVTTVFVALFAVTGLLNGLVPSMAQAEKKGSSKHVALKGMATQVSVADPYIREVPPGQETTALFMKLSNKGEKAATLVAVKGSVAKSIELHSNVEENGELKMRPVDKIDIPAGGSAELKPGSLHVMLIGLIQPIKDGLMIPLTLAFADGSEAKFEARVINLVKNPPPGSTKGSQPGAPAGGHSHH